MMQAALAAIRYQGATWPNPCVGCALTDAQGHILAAACSQKGGRPHAETTALAAAPNPYAAWVTLEPCVHASPGKPVSCTDALIASGLREIHVGIVDPDPRMGGRALARLRTAGIKVHLGEMRDACYHAHRGHITRTNLHRPYTTLKIAHTRDNLIGRPGERTPISATWPATFALRAQVDGVMIGIETALTDDPQLTDRRPEATHQPVRIVVDTNARLPASSRLARTARDIPTWLLTMKTAAPDLEAQGVRIITCPLDGTPDNPRIDLRAALRALAQAGLTHIMVEGGARLAATMIAQALVDEAVTIESSLTLGDGIPAPALRAMQLRDETRIENDIWRTWDSLAALSNRADFFEMMEKL